MRVSVPLAKTLMVLMRQPARGSAPSPDDWENWKVHEEQL